MVSAQPYIINRQASTFPETETFNPDRWLVDTETYKVLYKSLWTFSSGPRGCIGRELALSGMPVVALLCRLGVFVRLTAVVSDQNHVSKPIRQLHHRGDE